MTSLAMPILTSKTQCNRVRSHVSMHTYSGGREQDYRTGRNRMMMGRGRQEPPFNGADHPISGSSSQLKVTTGGVVRWCSSVQHHVPRRVRVLLCFHPPSPFALAAIAAPPPAAQRAPYLTVCSAMVTLLDGCSVRHLQVSVVGSVRNCQVEESGQCVARCNADFSARRRQRRRRRKGGRNGGSAE